MSNAKRCRTCEFCSEIPDNSVQGSICRGDFPKAFLVPVQTLQGNALQATTIWPQVNADIDFCRNHSPKLSVVPTE